MAGINKLIEGYKNFHTEYFRNDKSLYKRLKEIGQAPKTLVIACSDSRVDPGIITKSGPGDIFVVRNVANLVPPYTKKENRTLHGVSAALEFGVRILEVENIIILGHSHCAGVRAMFNPKSVPLETDFIGEWVKIATPAKKRATTKYDTDEHQQQLLHHCERETILLSLDNLLTFPWIKERVIDKKLQIHGWYFSLGDGSLKYYDQETGNFIAFETE